MELQGRVALVTGAARRVGAAIAERLAGAGCAIALHYNNSEADAEQTAGRCRAAGARVELFRADLSDLDATRKLAPRVLAAFGRLDVLVNNASIFERMTLDRFDQQAWERTMRVNVTAPMLLAHSAAPALRAARGRVVNLCDIAVDRPWPDYLAYVASKGALATLTKALARALAPGVNVVGVAPGIAAWPETYDEKTRQMLLQRVPLKRAGSAEDIAAAVHFLLKEGDYITGTILPVDGGRGVV